MATTILQKRGATTPLAANFSGQGQLIINSTAGTISFLKSDGTTVVTLTATNCQATVV